MNFKKLLPIESYTLTSTLNIDEIKKRISGNIEPKKTLRLSLFGNNSTKPYEGEISGDTFQISRIINYRNSFLPIITGHISSYVGQTVIEIKMQPATSVIVFMCLWLGIVGFVCLLFLMGELFSLKEITQNGFSFGTAIPFIMFLFGWLLTFLGFKLESKKSKQFLSNLLEGQEADNY